MIIYVLYILTDEAHVLGCSTSRQAVEAEKQIVINSWKKNLHRTPDVWIESRKINNNYCDFCK